MTTGTAPPPTAETDLKGQEEEGGPDIALHTDDVDAPVEREEYEVREPSADDMVTAHEALDRLSKKGVALGPGGTIDALCDVVDVVDPFRTPAEWPGKDGEEYHAALVVHEIAVILLEGCGHLQLTKRAIICTWRNKDKWMDGPRPKRGDSTKHNALVQHHLKGRLVTITINYHHWLTMNPLQKVQEVYHRLRERDAMGKKIPPQFTGYYDEPELFGLRVFVDNLALAEALEAAQGIRRQYDLPLEEEDEDVD